MNSPVTIKHTREQLLQRLSTRRPLYEAIKENLPKGKALHADMLEPRVLLSADLLAAGAALDGGLAQTADVLDQFIEDEDLLNADIPLLVLPSDSGDDPEAAHLVDLMSIDVDRVDENGDSVWGVLETELRTADTGGDDRVSLAEFFDYFFEGKLQEIDQSGTEADFASDLEALDVSAPGIDFTVDVAALLGNDDDNSLAFGLSVSLAITQEFDVDLGVGFDETGVTFNLDEDLRSEATTTLIFDMTIGADSIVHEVLDTTPDDDIDQSVAASADFYLQLGALSLGTLVSEFIGEDDVKAEDVQVGFMGVAATGSLSLRAGFNYQYSGDAPEGKLRSGDLPDVNGDLDADYLYSGGESSGNQLSGNIRLEVDGPFDTFFGAGSIINLPVLTGTDPFDVDKVDDRFNIVFDTASVQDDLNALKKFDKVDPSTIVAMLGKVASAADGIAGNEAVSGFDIPFTSSTVGDVLDFADLVADKLLYKDWPELWPTSSAVQVGEARESAQELLLTLEGAAFNTLTFSTLATGLSFIPAGSTDQQAEELLGSLLVLLADENSALYDSGAEGKNETGQTVAALPNNIPDRSDDDAINNWADWLENERSQLLDGDGKPTFKTVQELTRDLADIFGTTTSGALAGDPNLNGGIPLIAYANDELTLNLSLTQDVMAFDVPLDFNLDLGPIGNISNSSGALKLGGDVGLDVSLGIDLGEVQGFAPLADDTPLTGGAIRVDIETQAVAALTSDPIDNFSRSVLPDLTNGATFELDLTGTIGNNGLKPITVPPQIEDPGSDNARNTKLSQLADDINRALNEAGVSAYIVAERTPDYFKLSLSGPLADDNDAFSITQGSSILGLLTDAATTTTQSFIEASNPATPSDLTLNISGNILTVEVESLAYNSNILNLARDLNQAILADELKDELWVLGDALDEDGELIPDPNNEGATLQEKKPKVVVSSVGNQLVITQTELFDLPSFTVSASDFGFSGTPNLDDFIITTSDGVEHPVSLAGATTIANPAPGAISVASIISAATGGHVVLSIDQDRLVLTETFTDRDYTIGPNGADGTDGTQTRFSVTATNGSKAALQLGIVGIDGTIYEERDEQGETTDVFKYDGRDGVIEGLVISGPTLADRVFLDNASIGGSIALTASSLSAVGSFGFVDVTLSGTGSLSASLDVGLKNPIDASSKFTLAQIENFFFDKENPPTFAEVSAVIDPTFSAGGMIALTVGVDSGVSFLDEQAAQLAENPIVVSLEIDPDDLSSLPTFSFDTSSLSNLTLGKFSDIGFSEILDGIRVAAEELSKLEGFDFLDEPIPLVNASVTDFLSIADKLDSAVQSALENPSGSLQQLEQGLESAFGIADENLLDISLVFLDETNTLVSSGTANAQSALRVDLALDLGFSEYVGLDLDLEDALAAAFGGAENVPELLAGATLAGSAGLAATGNVRLNLAFGVGLEKDELVSGTEKTGDAVYDDGNLGDVYVFGGNSGDGYDTGITGDLTLSGSDLNFRGAIGPAGIFVQGGTASAVAEFGAGLDATYVFGGDAPVFNESLFADFEAILPVSFPTESSTPVDVTFYGGTTAYNSNSPELDLLLDGVPSVSANGIDELLAGFDPANLGLLDNILLVVDGVDLFLDGLQDVLDGDIGGMTLPLVGDKLADGAQFIADFRENFVDNFREGVQGFADPNEDSIVVTLLKDLLAQIGFEDATVDEFSNLNDVPRPAAEEAYIQWDVSFGDKYEVNSGIGLDLGIPGLGLETEGAVELTVEWDLSLGFGLSGSQGAFLDLEGEELAFGIDVRLAPGTVITGSLGFLQLSATDGGTPDVPGTFLGADFIVDVESQKSELATFDDVMTERLGFSDLGSLDFVVGIEADAVVDLDLNLRIDGADALPQINANLGLVWAYDGALADINGDAIKAGLQELGFNDVRIDAGSFLDEFLSPVLSEVQKVTAPLEDIVDFITAPLPVISDLGPSTSLLDIAQAILPQQLGFIESIDDLLAVVNSIPTDAGGLEIPFGDFSIFDAKVDDPGGTGDFDLGQLANSQKDKAPTTAPDIPVGDSDPSGKKAATKGFLDGLKSNGSLQFPFLSDPSQVFGLLTGGDIDLFEFVLKPLGVEFEYSQFFPIIGPLGASISGSFSAIAKLAFGFDTSGIRQFADSGFGDPGLIFNGLYLDDYYGTDAEVPELELNLSLEAAAELNLGVAKGGVSGGVYANVLFDLNDPNLDGKVRIEELLGNVIAQAEADGLAKLLAPIAVFDVSGDVYAQLKAFLEVDVLLFSIDYSENITPRINIFEFDIPFTRPVQLATEFVGENGPALTIPDLGAPQAAAFSVAANADEPVTTGSILQLSVGELAELRLNGDVSDNVDKVTVVQVSPTTVKVKVEKKVGNVYVEINETTYDVTDTILVRLGEGDDIFDASGVTSPIKFEVYGGSGNDDIILGGNASGSYVEGGVGDDLIVGTGGSDILIGQAGNDIILGEGGNDVISGDQLEISTSNTLQASPDVSLDGNDWISGGTDDDIIFGSGGADTLLGDAMVADVSAIADVDKAQTERFSILANLGVDTFIERSGADGADIIVGDGGLVDLSLLTSSGLQGKISPISLTGTGDSGADTIRAGGSADYVYGGGGDDNIRGGSGSDTIYGEEGSHIIYGGADGDTIYGGEQKDELYGGGGDDWIYGEGGDDYIQGDSENDKLFGGEGFDLILGNLGDDVLRGGSNADQLFGGAGNDYLDGDFGDDILFGDTDGREGIASVYGNDELVSTYGVDILDGEAGSDEYIVNFTGGIADRLVTTFDSGNAATGPDTLTINGSVSVSYDDTGLIRTEVFRGDDSALIAANLAVDVAQDAFDRNETPANEQALAQALEAAQIERSRIASLGPQVGDDNFLLRANPDRSDGLAFVALLGKDAALAAANQAVADAQEALDSGDSTASQEKVDAARALAQQLAAADSGDDYPIERVDYTASMETLIINSGFGRDYFALDDNRASTIINGGSGNDVFQIGQMFNLPRTNLPTEGNIQEHPNPNGPASYDTGETDIFATIETTRGFLSNGITEAAIINGGDDNDSFVVFHNKAVLSLNGDDGNDEFTVRAFALSGSQETFQERTDISGGTDADLVQYAVNAPVNIDGGDGEDTVRVIGTEFGDDFIVAKEGVFGVGVNVTYTNVESLEIDGGAGDDRFFIQGTNAGTVTTIVGGLGSDSFNVAGDPPPIISNDLLGHSGKISHSIVTAGEDYKEVRVRDVVANVADSNEPGIVITPADELPRVVQSSGITSLATYQVVLTQAPKSDEKVVVTAIAPRLTNEDGTEAPLIQFVGANDELTDSTQIVFDGEDWFLPQTVTFSSSADVDLESDESRLGNLVHSIKTERISASNPEEFVIRGTVTSDSNEPPIITLDVESLSKELPTDGSLIGATIKVTDGLGEGQTRGIGDYEGGGIIELTTSWNIVPDGTSEDGNASVEIRLASGEIITGDIVSAENRTTLTSSVDLPNANGNGGGDLRGATVEIISGTGIGQERLIMSSTGTELTLNKPWTTELDEDSIFQIQSYSAVKAPALEVRVDGGIGLPLPADADNTPLPGVQITESKGSTNVIEPTNPGIASDISTDSYDVVLTKAPDANVKVYVQPEETITTRGQVFYKQVQVAVGGNDLLEDADGKYLLFTPENHATPQTVEVVGTADGVVDGGDTKVFPSIPRVLSDLQGELILEGAGESDIGIGSLGDPLMLPLENNTPPAFGNIVSVDDTSSAIVSKEHVVFALGELSLGDVSVLRVQQYTLEITEGVARGQAVIIQNIETDPNNDDNYLITFDDLTEWDDQQAFPDDTSRFTFSTTNPNLLVNESEQVDIVTIFNNESVSNDKGTLTEDSFTLKLGGADDSLDGNEITANITYLRMENVTVNLGLGDDELAVESTHTRFMDVDDEESGEYQTVTFINAGPGMDTINISGIDSFLAVKGELGDDTIDASAYDPESGANPLIAFGDEGQDTIRGGAGNDILFGDLGRIDYFENELDAGSQLVTRVGLELDFDTMFDKPETLSDPLQVPADQTDGEVRNAKLIVARNYTVGDIDNIYGNGGDDIIIGGTESDRLDGGAGSDLVLGDNARISRLADDGNLAALNVSLSNDDGPLYVEDDPNGAANVAALPTDGTGTYDRLNLILVDHEEGTNESRYGDDYLAGGSGDDYLFGQKGADTVQGDGKISNGLESKGTETNFGAEVTDGVLAVAPSEAKPASDGDDYVEGNDGEDTIFGNLGQDILIGGSSDLFGLDSSERQDGADLIFGGAGNQVGRNNEGTGNSAADADLILGDNARVVTLPDESYDYNPNINVRAYTLLDYTAGVDNSAAGLGGADEIHGEMGDDIIHGMIGNDVLFGEAQNDDIIGGVGNDRIYGGTGVDGILGDDGLVLTSKNGSAEPLNGVAKTTEDVIRTKGKFIGAVVNPTGEIHKAADLQAWDKGGNDVIYGGWGGDFIHGGDGDDAISGAEARVEHYHSLPHTGEIVSLDGVYTYAAADPLGYDPEDRKLAEFVADNPRPEIEGFLLNFDASEEDGIDFIFGDQGNDWLVGGTNTDRIFGGLGDDLINADDNLTAPWDKADDAPYADGDFVYGGGGLDVMIANTAQDRLFDWSGEFNSYYVPFSLFGAPTVNRKVSPDTVDFLMKLGVASGADMSLGGSGSGYDELGLVPNSDGLAGDQRGSPRDPQPGNLKGQRDDVGGPESLLLADSEALEQIGATIVIDDLRAVGHSAVERWLQSGLLNDQQLETLSGMHLQITDLGGLQLAQASNDGKTIYIDSNAAGHGWFVDATAGQDQEFINGVGASELVVGKMDLLSVVMHEIGHQLGFAHGQNGLMNDTLDTGLRTAALLATDTLYTFDDERGLEQDQATVSDDWVELAASSVSSGVQDSGGTTAVDWNDSF